MNDVAKVSQYKAFLATASKFKNTTLPQGLKQYLNELEMCCQMAFSTSFTLDAAVRLIGQKSFSM